MDPNINQNPNNTEQTIVTPSTPPTPPLDTTQNPETVLVDQKKSNPLVNFVAVLLIILIIAGVGYFAYTKGFINFDFLRSGNESAVEVNDKSLTVTEIDEIVKSLDEIDEYSIKVLSPRNFFDYSPKSVSARYDILKNKIDIGGVVGYIKNGELYKVSLHDYEYNQKYSRHEKTEIDYYIYNNNLISVVNTGGYSEKGYTEEFGSLNKIKYYFYDASFLETKIIKQDKNLTYIQDQEQLVNIYSEDVRIYLELFPKAEELGKVYKESLEGKWLVKDFGFNMRDLGEAEEEAWLGKVLEIKNNILHFDFTSITGYGNDFDFNKNEYCNILNLDKPEISIYSIDRVEDRVKKVFKTSCSEGNPFQEFSINQNSEMRIWWGNTFFILVKDKKNKEVQQHSNTKTEYMCADKVKIVTEQESPSIPPRVSYIRASDGATVAYYGDFGAYIYPEYFSIDRSQIEKGYEFDEANFCKYLKY